MGPVSMLPSGRTGPWAVNSIWPLALTAQEKGCLSGGSPTSMICFMDFLVF